jgi:hypothetical protein
MAEAAAPADPRQNTLALLLVETAAVTVVPVLCRWARWDEGTTTVVTTAAAAVPPWYVYLSRRRRRDPVQEVDALGHAVITRPVVLVVLILAVSLLAVDRLLSGLMGFLAGMIVATTGGDGTTTMVVAGLLSLGVTIPCLLAATFLMSRHAGYYLGGKPIQRAMVAVVLYTVLSIVIAAFAGLPLNLILLTNLVLLPVLLGLSAWGAWASKKRRAKYAASKLFEKLDAEDQLKALAHLGQETSQAVRDHRAPVRVGAKPRHRPRV